MSAGIPFHSLVVLKFGKPVSEFASESLLGAAQRKQVSMICRVYLRFGRSVLPSLLAFTYPAGRISKYNAVTQE